MSEVIEAPAAEERAYHTAGTIREALAKHYGSSDWVLMFEVANGTGAHVERWADAVAMNLWPSRGLVIEGMEIKVSRSDWKRELERPEKAEAIAQHCDYWWLVTPMGLKIEDGELPDTWGHKAVRQDGSVVVLRKAERHERRAEIPRPFVAAMLRAMGKIQERASTAAFREEVNKHVENRVQYERDRLERSVGKAAQIAAALEEAFPGDWQWIGNKQVIAALQLVHRLGMAEDFGPLAAFAGNLAQVQEKLAEAEGMFRDAYASLGLEVPVPAWVKLPKRKKKGGAL